MSDVFWPYACLPPRKVTPEVVPASMSGGRGITAIEQITLPDAGYWQIDLDEIPIASRNHKIAWRAIAAQLQGRAGTIQVPLYDTDGTPWPLDANGNAITGYPQMPHSDDSLFSDGTGYAQTVISAAVSAAASLGAVQVSLSVTNADVLQPGQHFSVMGAEKMRLYRIQSIVSYVSGKLTDDLGNQLYDDNGNPLITGPDAYTVQVNLPLREAIVAGSPANFDDPRCTCRAATDREFDTGTDDYAGRTLAKVTFVESLP